MEIPNFTLDGGEIFHFLLGIIVARYFWPGRCKAHASGECANNTTKQEK